jgi:hypothetical protein
MYSASDRRSPLPGCMWVLVDALAADPTCAWLHPIQFCRFKHIFRSSQFHPRLFAQ